jgi:cytochrome oxidase Cu insertion factor (SCO1/SenC/PrrC family)
VEPLTAAVVILAVLMLLMAAAGAGLYRRVRELELATYQGVGLSLGTGPANAESLALTVPGQKSVLVKVNRRCPVCDELLAEVAQIAARLDDDIQLVVLSDDPDFDRVLPERVRVVTDPDAWRAVTVPYVPAVLVVDERGIVVHTSPGGSAQALERVVDQFANSRKEAGI